MWHELRHMIEYKKAIELRIILIPALTPLPFLLAQQLYGFCDRGVLRLTTEIETRVSKRLCTIQPLLPTSFQ